MKRTAAFIALIALLTASAASAYAQQPMHPMTSKQRMAYCSHEASVKHLHGAAHTSFMKRCLRTDHH